EAGRVERVEVELERLGLDQAGRIGRYHHGGGAGLRAAAAIQPAKFVGMPAVVADEGKRGTGGQPKLGAGTGTRDREQQRRVGTGRVGDLATEAGILGSIQRHILGSHACMALAPRLSAWRPAQSARWPGWPARW